jgi:N-acetylglucosaminyldiphosphoundecaprenol N-acetyl-beta-D-mannosaminyltransferase
MNKTKSPRIHGSPFVKNYVLGVGVTNAKMEEILEYVKKGVEKYYIVTPNPEILVLSSRLPDLKDILNSAKIALNDGVGVSIAGQIMGKPFIERVTGVDFMKKLCEKVSDLPVTVGFLGAGPRIAELASECLVAQYPGLRVSFAVSDLSEIKGRVPKTDILFVALGAPKQEQWIANNINKLPVTVIMAVGGSFDYISGRVTRAPGVLRALGLEWLFRLIIQPWRIGRQLSLLLFVWLVLKEKFSE